MTTEARAMRAASAKIARESESQPFEGRAGGYAAGWLEACAYIRERVEVLPLPPSQPNPTVEAMAAALERLISAAKLLQANCEGCAVNHHGADFEQQGLPGWLADTQADIENARAALADFRKGEAP